MKIATLFVFAGIFLPMASHSEETEAEEEKIYVNPAQLFFADREMFAHVSGQWIPVNAIHSDADGFYIRNNHTRWICECYYNNYGGDATCKRRDEITGKFCGKPRPW